MSGGMKRGEGEELEKQSERAGANPYGGAAPWTLALIEVGRPNEMLQGLTQKAAPHSTRLRLPTGEIRNHAQASRYPSGTPTEDDLGTHQVGQLQGAETDGGAALHFDTMSEWDSNQDDLSRTAKYLQLNSVFAGAVNT